MGRPLPESELLDRARGGDEGAYGALVEMHEHIAFRVAYAVLHDAAEAEEAAQDGFVKAYRALGRFRRGSPFRPWLLRIVGNEARNRVRARSRREERGNYLATSRAARTSRATDLGESRPAGSSTTKAVVPAIVAFDQPVAVPG